jgi:hypothetical protein
MIIDSVEGMDDNEIANQILGEGKVLKPFKSVNVEYGKCSIGCSRSLRLPCKASQNRIMWMGVQRNKRMPFQPILSIEQENEFCFGTIGHSHNKIFAFLKFI